MAERKSKPFKGCRCRASHCVKKYCICYHNGIPCSIFCHCENCQNPKQPTQSMPLTFHVTGDVKGKAELQKVKAEANANLLVPAVTSAFDTDMPASEGMEVETETETPAMNETAVTNVCNVSLPIGVEEVFGMAETSFMPEFQPVVPQLVTYEPTAEWLAELAAHSEMCKEMGLILHAYDRKLHAMNLPPHLVQRKLIETFGMADKLLVIKDIDNAYSKTPNQ